MQTCRATSGPREHGRATAGDGRPGGAVTAEQVPYIGESVPEAQHISGELFARTPAGTFVAKTGADRMLGTGTRRGGRGPDDMQQPAIDGSARAYGGAVAPVAVPATRVHGDGLPHREAIGT